MYVFSFEYHIMDVVMILLSKIKSRFYTVMYIEVQIFNIKKKAEHPIHQEVNVAD